MLRNSNKNRHNNKIKQENESIFKSSKYLMSFVLDEYSKEFARGEKLDSKGMALITLLIGFLTLSFPVIDFKFVVNSFYVENNNLVVIGILCIVLLVVSLVLIIYTLITTLKIFKVREYMHFNTDNAKNINIQNKSCELVAASLIDTYVSDISCNQKVNNDKAMLIKKSYSFIIITVVVVLLTSILTIVGGVIMENELKNNIEKNEKELKITNSIDTQNTEKPKMKKSVPLMHYLTEKDLKDIIKSMD